MNKELLKKRIAELEVETNPDGYILLYTFKITDMIHELKTWKEYFEDVFMGHKTFEIRKNDRDFKKGDTLILKEWDNFRGTFTGRKLARTVTYVFEGGSFGLEKGFVVMAIKSSGLQGTNYRKLKK